MNREVYDEVCQLAFEKTIKNKQTLQHSECKFKLSEGDKVTSLGLIIVDRTIGVYCYEKIYTFPHLTFQEYLAARYISTLSENEQYRLIQEHGNKNYMLVVWKFYCGLVKIIRNDNRFRSILKLTIKNYLLHLQCAYESQQSIACTQVLKSMEYHIQLKNEYLSIPDFTAVGYVTSQSVISTKLSITNCNVDIEAINALLSEIKGKGKPQLQQLYFKSEKFTTDDLECLKILQEILKSSLQVLSVSAHSKINDCALHLDSNFADLTKLSLSSVDFGRHNTGACEKLTTLNLSQSITNFDAIQRLTLFFQSCVSLKDLDISFNEINDEGATVLASGLKYCRSLEGIIISNNQLTKNGVHEIFKSLQQCHLKIESKNIISKNHGMNDQILLSILEDCTSLQTLSLETFGVCLFNCLCSCSKQWKNLKKLNYQWHIIESIPRSHWLYTNQFDFTILSRCLTNFSELQILQLSGVQFNSKQARHFTIGLSYCSNLRVLNLTSNSIGGTEFGAMSSGIKCCTNLQELHLNYNEIEYTGAYALSTCVQQHHKLQQLHLRGNNIHVGARTLVRALVQCCNLQVLDLGENCIGDTEVEALSDSLQHCKDLKQLHIDRNVIESKGVKALSFCLQYCPKLVELNLSGNKIGSDGAKALAASLHHCSWLKTLNLSYNRIGGSAAETVLSSLKHYGHTKELSDDVIIYRLRAPSSEIIVKI